ncbi:hypothetical protein SAY87_025483 [Trapa incisa]|uniref:RING-type domain-containing protein n=1 Tax=Trapa incisa TaxID=236973 RepID=A0AAN7JGK1_9MYRT|nr:hypothetical protein SAY87_025483 [Trapa incisa]
MAIAGLQNSSLHDSSFLREPQSTASTQGLDPGRSGNRASSILQMWREWEDEKGLSPRHKVSEWLLGQESNASSVAFSSINASETSLSENDVGIENVAVSEDGPEWSGSQNELKSETSNHLNLDHLQSSDYGEAERERVRKIFREWKNNGASERCSGASHINNSPRTVLGETEQERVRIIRERVHKNSQMGPFNDLREDPATQFRVQINQHGYGSEKKGILRVCGRQVLVDMVKKAQRDRQLEIHNLLEHRSVSQFAHRNRIQSVLRGRFLRESHLMKEKSSSMAVNELGLLRQNLSVSGLREGFLSRLDRYSRTSSNLSHNFSLRDISDNRSDQDYRDNLSTGLNVTPEESINPTNVGRNSCESSDALDDSEHTIGVMVELKATGDSEQRQEPAAENGTSIDELSECVGLGVEEGGEVSLASASNALPNETRQAESADQANESPYIFSRREETSTSSLMQHTDHPLGSSSDSLRGGDSTVEELWLVRDFENEGNNSQVHAEVEHIESEWSLDQYDNEDMEGSYLSELPDEGNGDDDFPEVEQSWIEHPSSREISSSTRVGTFDPLEDDNAHSTEIQELLSRRRVSNLLSSGFRESLNQLIQSYVERQVRASNEWELDETSSDNPITAEHDMNQLNGNDEAQEDSTRSSSLPALHWDHDLHSYLCPHHGMHRSLRMEWDTINDLRIDMVRLHQRMDDMQRMLEACMDMQLDLQRSVKQEVSAALNRSTPSSGNNNLTAAAEDDSNGEQVRKSVCCICHDSRIDSLLYRCGHMCACSKCANSLLQSQGKCPMCQAPVLDAIRAYFIQ